MRVHAIAILVVLAACGDDGKSPGTTCTTIQPYAAGTDGVAHPLAEASATHQARAGRVAAADLPAVPSGLITWKAGDFVLANDRVALVIEDVGDSDLYDPWGGRPVGLARVEDGAMVQPNNFGEFFLLTGRSTVVTDSVSVIADGTDGGPAIVRARGKLHPIPFLESLLSGVFTDAFLDVDAAIDYELAPGSEHVDIHMRYASAHAKAIDTPGIMNALMYTKRTPVFQPNKGFVEHLDGDTVYAALTDEQATSWAYVPQGKFQPGIEASGFVGAMSPGFTMPACGETDRIHAQLVIGGPGADGIAAAVARDRGDAQRTITGTVTRGGSAPASGVHVHAVDAATGKTYYSRALTAADGTFALHVPMAADVNLVTFRRGDRSVTAHATADALAIDLPATGKIHVSATDDGAHVPVRVQVMGTADQIDRMPASFGEEPLAEGRLHVAFATTGDVTLDAPPGTWRVVVSRGYEYELVDKQVTVTAGATTEVAAALDHVVDTTGVQCGDFHVHTWRSNDATDDGEYKVSQAVADGLELPIRSDHEWVGDFSAEIAKLGLQAFAAGFPSIELTSMELWGHMGVFPLNPDPSQPNAGAPKWQTFPTAANPDTKFETLQPNTVFDTVRARPEQPVIIINHPRGPTNYFGYVGYDPATGTASADGAAAWDTKFTLVEVFNNSGWQANRNGNVTDWFGLLEAGRKIMAVGSSDSHELSGSPVGYPRTCLKVGTDDPRQLTASGVRDTLAAGHGAISGGIYVSAKLGAAEPGDTTTGAGSQQLLDITVQAASWVDVSNVEVVVDGEGDVIPVMPADADATNPTIRFHKQVPVTVRASGGFVVVAAYGDHALEPVHPGEMPFGVTEPIFVTP